MFRGVEEVFCFKGSEKFLKNSYLGSLWRVLLAFSRVSKTLLRVVLSAVIWAG